MKGASYPIKLENFYGPLDLLLHLIRKNEISIEEIRLSPIAEQYRAYLEEITKLDIEVASEFFVVAAKLMRMKSRALLPDDHSEEELDEEEQVDPGEVLIQNLLRYKKFKERATMLRSLRTQEQDRYGCPSRKEEYTPENPDTTIVDLSLWKLVRRYMDVTEAIELDAPSTIIYDDIPQELVIEDILSSLDERATIPFQELIGSDPSRSQVVSYFLGVLTLAKDKKLNVQPKDSNQDFVISRRSSSEESPEEEPSSEDPS